MSLSSIVTIYAKEMKETLRDRRTLVFMVLLPTVIMPMIMKFSMDFMSDAEKKAATETIKYAIFGQENMPELAESFEVNPGFEAVTLESKDNIQEAIRAGKISLALSIPKEAATQVQNKEQVTIDLYYNNANIMSKVKRRAAEVVASFGETQRDQFLASMGLNSLARDQLMEPFVIQNRGIATDREVLGAAAGGMLPYMFIIFCFLGCLYPAIDLGAGEKERGTLETLLLTPVPRWHLVVGKFAVIFTCGFISSTLSLSSMGVWLLSQSDLPAEVTAVLNSIGLVDVGLVISMLIPVAAMFAALLLSISIFSRSFKEAQSYATPLNILIIFPALIAMMPGIELDWTWAMVPITNIALAVKELVKGTMDYNMFAAILGSSSVIAGALLVFSAFWFERESVLFRE